jgi:TRAP-type C4-dicarboxylate transport system permease small subunit
VIASDCLSIYSTDLWWGGGSPPPTKEGEGDPVLDKFERVNRRLSSWFEWIGLAAMLVMMAITCIDVVGAKVFRCPLLGAIDIVMLVQIVAIAFAASMALILGRHIQVEFFFNLLPRRAQAVIDSIVLLLGLGLFMVIMWRLSVLGHLLQTAGDYSATIRIPYYPFAYGIALASIPVCLVFLLEFLKSLTKKRVQK